MSVKSLLITGEFAESDLMELVALFRKIERRQPDQTFMFAIAEADLTLQEGRALIKRIFPAIEDNKPFYATLLNVLTTKPVRWSVTLLRNGKYHFYPEESRDVGRTITS